MSTDASTALGPLSPFERLQYARQVIRLEADALVHVAKRLDGSFCRAVDLLYGCRGSVITSGMGKAGLIAQKTAATLASTGTRSHFLHAGEAFHGDLGRIHQDDVLLVFSQSGQTEEVVRLLSSLEDFGVSIIAVTGVPSSPLGQAAHVTINLGALKEACALGLAPSTSTTAMLAVGDALALVTSRMHGFQVEDFARFHPGGSLGRRLSKVDDHMRKLSACRLASCAATVREVIVQCTKSGRRSGAAMLIDSSQRLVGLFTDSDLARLLESHQEGVLDRPVDEVMTTQPVSVPSGAMIVDAVEIMAERKISELPVVDTEGRPLGLIDITDVVGLLPEEANSAQSSLPGASIPGAPSPGADSVVGLPTIRIFPNSASHGRRSK